jgi:large subunit ribosomal protein L21
MYAIVEIGGHQFRAESGKKLYVNRLTGKEGEKVSFDRVLLTDNGSAVQVGTPTVAGVAVHATIVGHMKDDKVLIFKKKRRKGYKVKRGHRQSLTQISIDSIS